MQPADIATITKNLNNLSVELQTKAIQSGLTKTAGPVKKAMQAGAPKQSGDLAKAVGQKKLTKNQKARLNITTSHAIIVGPNKKVNGRFRARLGNLIEQGAKAHIIKPKKNTKGPLLFRGGGFAKYANHPGFTANPFMQRALQQNQQNLTRLFYQGLANRMKKLKTQ